MQNKPHLGTLTHGSMRFEDLIPAFADELERLIGKNDRADDPPDVELFAEDEYDEECCFLLEELFDALDGQAPPYCRFGASEGDGADYGFWPVMESIEELPRVNDGDEAKALGEDAYFVNDHGNVTVFGGDGSVILEFV